MERGRYSLKDDCTHGVRLAGVVSSSMVGEIFEDLSRIGHGS